MMSQASTNLNNADAIDYYTNPTTDVWQDELDQPQDLVYATRHGVDLPCWPAPVSEYLNAFEDVDIVESRIPGETNIMEFGTEFVALSPAEARRGLTCSIIQVPETSLYITLEGGRLRSPRENSFFPDFFNIRRWVKYVMSSTPVSISQQDQPLKKLLDIPVTIHPEVVHEAEERGMVEDLETSIVLIQKEYNNLVSIEISLEHDPEITDRRTIRFTLSVSGDPAMVLHNEAQYKQHLRSSVRKSVRRLMTVTYCWD